MLTVANGGGVHPARNIVGCDFLHLVRLGIRAADDPLVRDSIAVWIGAQVRSAARSVLAAATTTMAMGRKRTAALSTARASVARGHLDG